MHRLRSFVSPVVTRFGSEFMEARMVISRSMTQLETGKNLCKNDDEFDSRVIYIYFAILHVCYMELLDN